MNSRLLILVLMCCVTLATLFIRVPLPSGGYFNFGDIGVVFGGLLAGFSLKTSRQRLMGGFFIGGIGSAAADLLSGYALFVPITLVAKGLEGICAAWAGAQLGIARYIGLLIGAVFMVSGYFGGEWLLPSTGLQGAIAELVPNLIQAAGGAGGGVLLLYLYQSMVGERLDTE